MTAYVITSGITTGYILNAGDTLMVQSGGSDSASVIDAGAKEYVLAGGSSYADTINTSALETISANGFTSGDVINSGGVLLLSSGAVGSNLTISAGGLLSGGGVLSNTNNTDYGTVTGIVLSGGAGLFVSSGGVVSKATVETLNNQDSYGQGIYVSSGGSAVSNTISAGGSLELDGGTATGTLVLAGGVLNNANGGALLGTTTNAGYISVGQVSGKVVIQSGGVDYADTVFSKGVEQVLAGAVTSNAIVSAGGLISGPGFLSGTGNTDAGTVTGVTLSGVAGLFVSSGGVVSSVTVETLNNPDSYSQGIYVSAGGSAVEITLSAGGSLDLDGGTATGTVVLAGGVLNNANGGALLGTTTNAGYISVGQVSGKLVLQAGGVDYADTVFSKGVEQVLAGAVTSNAIVSAGGLISGPGFLSGTGNTDAGTVTGVTLSGVAGLFVSSGGVVSSVTVETLNNPDSYSQGIYVSSGGAAVDITLSSGGSLELDGGQASGTLVLSGGYLNGLGGVLYGITSNGGVVSGAQISGSLIIESGSEDFGDTVLTGGTEIVSEGAITSNATVQAGASLSGLGFLSGTGNTDAGTVTGVTLSGVAGLFVSTGGVVSNVTVETLNNPDGYSQGIYVSAGGSAVDITLSAGGSLDLDGGTATGTVVLAGGVLNNANGGALLGATTNAGYISFGQVSGTLTIQSGGVDYADTVFSKGVEQVLAGAVTSNAIVSAGGLISGPGFLSGTGNTDAGTVTGVTLSGVAGLFVSSGGVVSSVTVETLNNPDAYSQGIYVSSGGLAVRTTVAGGGSLEVEAGGVASTTTIQQAGLLYVDGGGSIFGATISSGGLLSGAATASGVVTDYAGGVDSGTTFTSGSYDFFYAGATQNAVTVSSAATLELADLVVSAGSPVTIGPVLSAQTISGASLVAGAKVTALSATVLAGGVLTVAPGGFAYDTTVSSGGLEVVSAGASAVGADVLFGGVLSGSGSIRSVVDDAGVVSGVTVASGGLLDVLAGGEAGGLKVASGATVSVAAGATLQIGNLGSTTVYAGGMISGPGDLQGLVRTSGVVEDVTVGVGADGQLDVLSGGSASGVTVGVKGGMLLESGGTASNTVVTSGGVLSAATGGALTDATLTSGALLSGRGVASGLIEVGPGATIDNLTIASGATEAFYAGVSSPAAQAGVTIASGATLELDHDVVSAAFSIGPVTSRRVVSGATLSVGADLATQSAQIVAGGLEIVTSGGTATSTTVSSGGDLRLSAGGVANAATVVMGGVLSGAGTIRGTISDDGLISGVSVDGLVTVSSGASGEALSINAGGAVDVLAQGSATNTTVLAGGVLSAAAGAVTNGLLTVSSGGTAESAVLTSGATEQLYAGGIDSGVKISAGAMLELVSAQVAASTPLTVGPRTSNSTVDGATLSSGARLVTVAANVVSGGIETVVSGGQASATTVSSGGVERLSSGGYAEGATVLAGGVLSGAGVAAQTISDAGQVNGVAVGAGAVLDVLSGGSISGVTLRAGSTVSGTLGGSAHGRIVVESGSILDGQIGFTSGATDLDYAGSVESGVRVSGGAVLELVSAVISGGTVSAGLYSTPKTVSGIAVLSGADLQTLSTTIVDSGTELVTSGGSIVSTFVSSGGVLSAAAGGYVSGLVVLSGGEALGAGALKGMTTDAGKVSGLVLGAGADLDVTAGGSANGIDVSSGSVLSAASGAILYDVREAVGGLVVDNGGLVYDQAETSILDGSLSGSGSITEESTGVLRLSAIAAGYDGALTIVGGTVDIALKGGLGTGSVAFEAATASATVEIETADQPTSGSTLANMLVDFDGANDTLDLRGLAFVKGASATVSGSILTFTDGAYTAKFDLVGAVAGSYSAVSDGAGGTKIIPIANGSDAIIHAAAAFGGDKGLLGAASGAGAALSAQSLGFHPSSAIRHGGQNLPA